VVVGLGGSSGQSVPYLSISLCFHPLSHLRPLFFPQSVCVCVCVCVRLSLSDYVGGHFTRSVSGQQPCLPQNQLLLSGETSMEWMGADTSKYYCTSSLVLQARVTGISINSYFANDHKCGVLWKTWVKRKAQLRQEEAQNKTLEYRALCQTSSIKNSEKKVL